MKKKLGSIIVCALLLTSGILFLFTNNSSTSKPIETLDVRKYEDSATSRNISGTTEHCITVTPSSYDFGEVIKGHIKTKKFRVEAFDENFVNINLWLEDEHDCYHFLTPWGSFQLEPGQVTYVELAFIPNSYGNLNAIMHFDCYSPNHDCDDVDVHVYGIGISTCFPAGTKITMADGSYKNIEDIKQGDRIMSYDFLEDDFSSWTVFVIPEEPLNEVYEINDGLLNVTRAHPLYIKKPNGETGWGAITPTNSVARLKGDGLKLEIGDQLFTSNKEWVEVTKISLKSEPIQVYNIWSFSGKQNYYANDILVFEERAQVPYPTVIMWFIEQFIEQFMNRI